MNMDGVIIFFIVATVIGLMVGLVTAVVYIMAVLKYGRLLEKLIEEEKNK